MSNGFSRSPDPDVLERARAGDMQAHAALFHLYGRTVATLARRLVARRDIAEEIMQETFLDVLRRITDYRGDAPFGFWLRRIALNRCLMFLRTQRGAPLELPETEPESDASDLSDALVRADLETLLDRLPPLSRAVLWLHEVEGYTHREIAELLGKTTSFSKSQLARSHERLRVLALQDAESAKETMRCMPKSAS